MSHRNILSSLIHHIRTTSVRQTAPSAEILDNLENGNQFEIAGLEL